jgi:hypothetical protein
MMFTFSERLRDRTDEDLVTLMLRRPDLANPAPTTLASLAARATSRASLERAVARLDAFTIQVLEAVVILHEVVGQVNEHDLATAVGADAADMGHAVEQVISLALVWADDERAPMGAAGRATVGSLRPAPGLSEVLGPFPAGLGPVLPTSLVPEASSAGATVGAIPRTALLGDALDEAPSGALEVLAALTWGPPVGRVPADRGSTSAKAASWLVRSGLLIAQDAKSVVLPRHVGLALRDGRTHQSALTQPPRPVGVRHPASVVDSESARSAEEIMRLVTVLVRTWERTPPAVLRSGGLGVRELHRVAQQLETDDTTAALVAELAQSAGLVIDDGEDPPAFAPTAAVDSWLGAELPAQWAWLARAWARSDRTPWVAGVRGPRGSQPSALNPDLRRSWAARLRRVVLEVLSDNSPGEFVSALSADDVLTVLAWRTPRAIPPTEAVDAILNEATFIGVLGVGALSGPGRALLAELTAERSGTVPSSDSSRDPEAALADLLAPPVDDLLLQGDLTGVVPGRPTPALAHLLDCTAEVESRGAALTVRFTPETVRRALDDGRGADEVLADLAAHSRTTVPQALDYLVRDAARRHGRLRVGLAGGYIRAADPALLAGLTEDPTFARLGLIRLAPTVIASQAPMSTVLEALRVRGLSPSAEGPDGQVVLGRPSVHRVRGDRRRLGVAGSNGTALSNATDHVDGSAVVHEPAADRAARYSALVPHLRGADRAAAADRTLRSREAAAASGAKTMSERLAAAKVGTRDPAEALGTLREAVAGKLEVWIEIVGPAGTPSRRRVRPITVEGGRVRAIDVERESELTIAVHRIASVIAIDPTTPTTDPTSHTTR